MVFVLEIEFFCVETAYLVSVRLKKLCESQCEDLALNLVTAFMDCYKISKTQNFNLNASETQIWFIFDTYIALLYKFQEKQKIVVLVRIFFSIGFFTFVDFRMHLLTLLFLRTGHNQDIFCFNDAVRYFSCMLINYTP